MFSIQGCSFHGGLSPGRESSKQAKNKMILEKWSDFALAIASPCAEQRFMSQSDHLQAGFFQTALHLRPKEALCQQQLGVFLADSGRDNSFPFKLQVLNTFRLPILTFPCKQGVKSKK